MKKLQASDRFPGILLTRLIVASYRTDDNSVTLSQII
jgi:hypothetical protein